MRFVTIVVLAAACAGCATITRGTTSQVQIQSVPSGAEARTSMGHQCMTPCTLQFNRKDEFVVTISKPGYHSVEIPVTTHVAGSGVAGAAGNVVLGGGVGLAVDVFSGGTLEHVPNPVIGELVPLRPGEKPRVIRQAPPAASQGAPANPALEPRT
jgi:hypothetical protein